MPKKPKKPLKALKENAPHRSQHTSYGETGMDMDEGQEPLSEEMRETPAQEAAEMHVHHHYHIGKPQHDPTMYSGRAAPVPLGDILKGMGNKGSGPRGGGSGEY